MGGREVSPVSLRSRAMLFEGGGLHIAEIFGASAEVTREGDARSFGHTRGKMFSPGPL